jgi:uncharacterized membrane protein YcaP (DUF421 family)
MDSVIRAAIVYVTLLVIFRIAGKRSLAQITTFDFVLLLIISEAIQQAMIDTDNSMISAFLIVLTLIAIDIGLSFLKRSSNRLERVLDDVPVILIEDGKLLRERMHAARVDSEDILQSARELQGIERLDQIKYAVLERSGQITVIPANG